MTEGIGREMLVNRCRKILLGPDEPPAVELVNTGGSSPVVLIYDHASKRVPKQLGTLGFDMVQLADHIGWDPGVAVVARHLSSHLDASLVLSGYSRQEACQLIKTKAMSLST